MPPKVGEDFTIIRADKTLFCKIVNVWEHSLDMWSIVVREPETGSLVHLLRAKGKAQQFAPGGAH